MYIIYKFSQSTGQKMRQKGTRERKIEEIYQNQASLQVRECDREVQGERKIEWFKDNKKERWTVSRSKLLSSQYIFLRSKSPFVPE